jgi:ribose transport system substrate-binding protein
MEPHSENGSRYLVGAFVQACDLMAAFRRPGELLRLRDFVTRTGLSKGTVFRLLYTLRHTGFIEKASHNEYRLRFALPKRSRWRLGYDASGKDAFGQLVTAGLMEAALASDLELLVLDNRNEKTTALRNADILVREHVDLAIEFQAEQSISEVLRAKFEDAGIPLIAIDVPLPGAVYFGANNYHAGTIAGREMGRWARLNWPHEAVDVVLIGQTRAGALLHSRLKGMLAGFKETRGLVVDDRVFQLDSVGDYLSGQEAVSAHLERVAPRKMLVGAVCDQAALGALHLLDQRGLTDLIAVIGQNAEPEARAELRRPNSRMIGSVAHFPEKYGRGIVALVRKILTGAVASSVVFMKHTLITRENVDRFYQNDPVLVAGAARIRAAE